MLIILQCAHTLTIQVLPVVLLGPDPVIQNCVCWTLPKLDSFNMDEANIMRLSLTCLNYLMEILISLAWYNRPQDH